MLRRLASSSLQVINLTTVLWIPNSVSFWIPNLLPMPTLLLTFSKTKCLFPLTCQLCKRLLIAPVPPATSFNLVPFIVGSANRVNCLHSLPYHYLWRPSISVFRCKYFTNLLLVLRWLFSLDVGGLLSKQVSGTEVLLLSLSIQYWILKSFWSVIISLSILCLTDTINIHLTILISDLSNRLSSFYLNVHWSLLNWSPSDNTSKGCRKWMKLNSANLLLSRTSTVLWWVMIVGIHSWYWHVNETY